MSLAEIAETTGVPLETARSRLRYARATLRQTLEGLL
jgi:RNA polymerase sigma-70 factor (ECF subfamily)